MKLVDKIWGKVSDYAQREISDINAISLTVNSLKRLYEEIDELEVYGDIDDGIVSKVMLLETHFGLKIYLDPRNEKEFELLIKIQ